MPVRWGTLQDLCTGVLVAQMDDFVNGQFGEQLGGGTSGERITAFELYVSAAIERPARASKDQRASFFICVFSQVTLLI